MAQAILTKYHGPGNVRGSRISAEAAAGKIFVPYDHALDIDDNHKVAALALIRKFGWERRAQDGLAHGTLPSGDHVHVFKRD
jgi:hypothetical protein